MNPNTVDYLIFKNKLKSIKKANEFIRIKWYNNSKHFFSLQGCRNNTQNDYLYTDSSNNSGNNQFTIQDSKSNNSDCSNSSQDTMYTSSTNAKGKARQLYYPSRNND